MRGLKKEPANLRNILILLIMRKSCDKDILPPGLPVVKTIKSTGTSTEMESVVTVRYQSSLSDNRLYWIS